MKRLLFLLLLASCSTPSKFTPMSPCPDKPNCVSSLEKGDHKIEPISSLNPKKTLAKIKTELKLMDNVQIKESTEKYIHAVFTSSFFKFKDDVEFMIQDKNIQIKSASRVGYSDMGVNRKRLEKIKEILK